MVKDAYAAVGVEQPADVWGLSWKLWLPAIVGVNAPTIHAAKQEAYEGLIASGALPRLPGADMAIALRAAGHTVYFVTAASELSACAVIKGVGLDTEFLWAYELSSEERTEALDDIRIATWDCQTHTYIDDRLEGGDVAEAAGFAFIHAPWMQ